LKSKEAYTMSAQWFRALTACTFCLGLLPAAPAADKSQPPAKPAAPEKVLDYQALAARIDAAIQEKWDKARATPTRKADDAEYLRRVSLDIIGRTPTVAEIHEFLGDKSPDKRQKIVAKLLDSYGYVNHFTTVWRDLIVPQGGNNQFAQAYGGQMEVWLTKHLKSNTGYNEMVRELLTADPIAGVRRGQPQVYDPNAYSVIAFYQANEMKPDNVAATVSRIFMGVKLECAQCHDHPFNRYSREQFWQTAAFFSGLTPNRMDGMQFVQAKYELGKTSIKIPNTERLIKAKFLDGKQPKFEEGGDPRAALADWLIAGDNPYFGRAAVNYLWAHFFGLGIIDPVDEPSETNPPSHPSCCRSCRASSC